MHTHEDYNFDKENKNHNGTFGDFNDWSKNHLDLDALWGGPGLKYFYDMVEWCIDNCSKPWYLDWNSESVGFDDDDEAAAFKLRWF